jgi:hypothetical protein
METGSETDLPSTSEFAQIHFTVFFARLREIVPFWRNFYMHNGEKCVIYDSPAPTKRADRIGALQDARVMHRI